MKTIEQELAAAQFVAKTFVAAAQAGDEDAATVEDEGLPEPPPEEEAPPAPPAAEAT